jgi:4-nitrophenyl phosphatase
MTSTIPSHIRGLILDMDGVLWRDTEPIGDLGKIFDRIRSLRLKVTLATNNSTRTVQQYLDRLEDFGAKGIEGWQVITSALATADLLSRKHPASSTVYVFAEQSVKQAITDKGLIVVDESAKNAEIVVVGIDREISFAKLKQATLLIRRGAKFYATNPDRTFPTPEGLIPGAGSIIAAVAASTYQEPIMVGKPSPYMMQFAVERMNLKPEECLVVGDRIETDIAGGQAIGCATALVLSGVSTREESEAWAPKIDIVANDLSELIGL